MNDEQKRIDLDSSFIVHPSSFTKRILEFDTVASTNSIALELANDPANHGVVILAREQTAGRGQYGRSWLASPGSSVLMSILLFPPPALRRPPLLTAWAAVSVCELCQQLTGVPARIKWPNDVLIQDRKVCGILIEQRAAGADSFASVVGIGLNVTQSADDFAAAGLMEAASLAVFSQRAFDARQISDDLLGRLDKEYQHLAEGDLASLEGGWKTHLGLLGKEVTAECIKETIQGRLLDVSFTRLELEVDKKRVCLAPEAVRHVEEIG
jgi:BirA family biotin operon repressor/biotin-[acetyl-CoA-carboxylase] ligase